MTQSKEILVVDDDEGLVDVLSMALEDAGFVVRTASDGKIGLGSFRQQPPDLVILDLLMPEIDGLELCKIIRDEATTPVIMLTSRDHEMDRIIGLEVGADDYVTKPFSTRELIARIRATLRRVDLDRPREDGEESRTCDRLTLNRDRREVRVGDQVVDLTATEFDLLWAMTSRPGVVFERDRLIDVVYQGEVVVATRTIDTFVKRLRSKLGRAGFEPEMIETVRGVGYRMRA